MTPVVAAGWLNTLFADGIRDGFGGRQHGFQQTDLARKVACGELASAPRFERIVTEMVAAPHIPTWRITAVFENAAAAVRALRADHDGVPAFLDANHLEQLVEGRCNPRQIIACGCTTVGTLSELRDVAREHRAALDTLIRATEREIALRSRPALMR